MANWLGFHQLYNEAFEVRFGLFAQFHHCIAGETELFSSLKYQSTHTTHRRDYFQSFYPDRSEAGMGGQKWKKTIIHGSHASGSFGIRKGKSGSPFCKVVCYYENVFHAIGRCRQTRQILTGTCLNRAPAKTFCSLPWCFVGGQQL